jgi:tRNA modification GTPase
MSGETLFALASAPGRAAIAVWRLSGPGAAGAVLALTRQALPAPRRASLRQLGDPSTGIAIDQALVLWFPGPDSFTGEDSAELHSHGGRAVAEAIAAALGRLPGLRPAEPGEFSRRAFLNGKLDLTEAEAIADLAAAETEAQRRQALAQVGGALSTLYDGWRAELIRLRAHLEADIEFPDEDIGDPVAQLSGQLDSLRADIAAHLADARRGERLREGVTIAVVGAPNAGKSSLVNSLARRDVAIVSPEAGTTRDAIDVHLDLGGYPVILVDTAGLRDTGGMVELEGIARARARAGAADLVLALFAADAERDAETLALLDERAVVVRSKVDLGGGAGLSPDIAISTKTNVGIDVLLQVLTGRVTALLADRGTPPPTRARHREALTGCLAALVAAGSAPLPELAAEDLRSAADELGRITGRIDIEDMLDAIFRDFCIGK